MSDDVTADEIAAWIDRENITVRASSQRGYKRWLVVYLDGSLESWLIADAGGPYLDAMREAYRRWQADPGGVRARERAPHGIAGDCNMAGHLIDANDRVTYREP